MLLPEDWQRVFRGIAVVAVVVVVADGLIFLTREAAISVRCSSALYRAHRLGLDRRPRRALHSRRRDGSFWRSRDRIPRGCAAWCVLSLACYALMTLEVWLVFWAIGQPMSRVEQR